MERLFGGITWLPGNSEEALTSDCLTVGCVRRARNDAPLPLSLSLSFSLHPQIVVAAALFYVSPHTRFFLFEYFGS